MRMLQTKNKNQNTKGGFTLLETMVAIFILTISITGPMVFAQSGLRTAFLARDQITAFFLAQDAIETIKNIRDTNGLDPTGPDWLRNIDVCNAANAPGTCKIYLDTAVENPVAEKCGTGAPTPNTTATNRCPEMDRDVQGWFMYDAVPPAPSRFTRTIYISETISNKEAQIIVEVSWTSNVRVGKSRITVQENMYNWIPGVNN
jgi:prepilin-type N-terminal cleavage/methylation domain-containing protein